MFSQLTSALLFTDRLRFVLAFVITVSVFHPASTLAQWRMAPSIGVGVQHDDNPILTSGETFGSVNGYLIEADANITFDSPLTNFLLIPMVRLSRYDKLTVLNSDDYFLNFNYKYTGQRSRFRVRGSYSDESSRTAERSDVDFEIEDPDDIPDDASGRVLSAAQRQRITLVPQWSYQIGQRSLIRIGANYIDTTYDDSILQTNFPFRQIRGTAGFLFNWSETSAVTLAGYYREVEITDRSVPGYGVAVGMNRSLTENTQFVFNIGMDATEDVNGRQKDTNPIGQISLVHNMETSRILASYRRNVAASGAGHPSLRDSVNLDFTHDFNEKISIGTGVSAYQTSALGADTVGFDEREYIQFRALLTWNLTRVFSIDLDYNYTYLDRQNLPTDADSNLVNLWFRYRRAR